MTSSFTFVQKIQQGRKARLIKKMNFLHRDTAKKAIFKEHGNSKKLESFASYLKHKVRDWSKRGIVMSVRKTRISQAQSALGSSGIARFGGFTLFCMSKPPNEGKYWVFTSQRPITQTQTPAEIPQSQFINHRREDLSSELLTLASRGGQK